MKRVLAWVLLMVMVLGMFAGCKPAEDTTPTTEPSTTAPQSDIQGPGAQDAIDYLKSLYQDDGAETAVDFNRYGIIRVGGIEFNIVWTVDVSEDLVKVVANEDGTVTIDINEQCQEATPYKLTATITDANGNVASHSWSYTLPKAQDMVEIVKAAYALGKGESLPYQSRLIGKIISIDAIWTDEYQNITVTIAVEGAEDMPIKCYRMKATENTVETIKNLLVGNIITVTGTLKNYEGTIEFDAGCLLEKVEKGDAVEALTDPGEILKAAYALAKGESLPNPATLTGTVIEIDSPYDPNYGNISVVIEVEGYPQYPMLCYRLKGTGVDEIAVDDLITVSGIIKNYNGKIEYDAGCMMLERVSGGGVAQKPSSDAAKILADAAKLSAGEKLPYIATLTGEVYSVDNAYDPNYGNVTVTMKVNGVKIQCYRMVGDGIDQIRETDTITVSGVIENYNGKLEFGAKCNLDSWEKGPRNVNYGPVKEDVAYRLYLDQKATGNTIYFNGKFSSNRLQTTTTGSKGADVYAERVSGKGLRFFYMDGETKTYIEIQEYTNDEGKQRGGVRITTEPTCYWVYNSDFGIYVVNLPTAGKYLLGTYNTYETLSASWLGYVDGSYPSSSPQYVAKFIEADKVSDEAPELPDGDTLTIQEALAMGSAMEHNTYTTEKYFVTGVITEVYSTTYGNMRIKDESGNILTIYGTYSADGSDRYDAMAVKPVVGDTVKIYGVVGQYNGTAQIKNGWIVEHTPAGEEPEPTEPAEPAETIPVVTDILEDGDQVVIYAPAYNKALSTEKVATYYNKGVNVAVSGGTLSGYSNTEIWTVVKNADGTYSFAYNGENIGLAAEFASMSMGAVNDDWTLVYLGDGLYNIKNVGRGNFMEWFSSKDNWSTYAASNAATDDQFQLSIYIVGEGLLGEETTEPEPTEPTEPTEPQPTEPVTGSGYIKVTSADQFTTGQYVMIVSTGYAPGAEESYWLSAVQPVVSGNTVTDTKGAVWTLTVSGNTVTLQDPNGKLIGPRGGNNNGLNIGAYDWEWSFENGTFVFAGTGEDTVYLASNANTTGSTPGNHRFRGYKTSTVNGYPDTYPHLFTLYKLSGEGSDPEVTEPQVTEPEATEPTVTEPSGYVTIAEALAASNGTTVTVKGVVTVVDSSNIYVQDETGAICVRMATKPTDISLGDTIIGTGSRADYNGMPQLGNSTYEKSSGMTLSARETTIGALTTADICTYVKISNLTVTAINDNNGNYTLPNITVEDEAGNSIDIYKAVVGKTGGEWDVKIGDVLTVTGAVGYHNKFQLRNTLASEIVIGEGSDPEVTEPEATEPEATEPEATGPVTGSGYIKVTSADQFTTGQYVMTVSTGYAPGVYENKWVTAAQPVVSGNTVTDTAGAVWTLTVNGSNVTLTDANGASIKPKGGNNNGIDTGDYEWAWSFNNGTFKFAGVGSDTVILASNTSTDPQYGGFNRFRGYKTTTISGSPSSYPCEFTLYKLSETTGEEPEVTEPQVTEPEATEPDVELFPVIFVDADNGAAMTALAENPTNPYGYLPKTDVAVEDGMLTGFVDANIFFFAPIEGTEEYAIGYIFDCYGRVLYMTGTFNSFNISNEIPAEGAEWRLTNNGDGTVYITNILKDKTVGFDSSYGSFGVYPETSKHTALLLVNVVTEEDPEVTEPEEDVSEPAATSVTYTFSNYQKTEQYIDCTVVLDEMVTLDLTNGGCCVDNQLRIYQDDTPHDGKAIFTCTKAIQSLVINAGYKVASLDVYGSDDGVTWTKVTTVSVTSTSYSDYSVEMPEGTSYKYLKLDAVDKQVRIPAITFNFA